MWTGILGNHVIGPFFIDGTLTSIKYLQMLQNEIIPAVRGLEVNFDIWFQQDNCPAHTARLVQAFLKETFPESLIISGGTIVWPPRSPDLTPLDFFFWGYVKQSIYGHEHNRARNLQELKQKIIDCANTITPVMFLHVRENFYHRLAYCQEQRGGLFEHLIN